MTKELFSVQSLENTLMKTVAGTYKGLALEHYSKGCPLLTQLREPLLLSPFHKGGISGTKRSGDWSSHRAVTDRAGTQPAWFLSPGPCVPG